MSYLLDHTVLGFCWLDLIAALLLVLAILYIRQKLKKMKEQIEDLEEQLAAQNAQFVDVNNKPYEAIEQNAPNISDDA